MQFKFISVSLVVCIVFFTLILFQCAKKGYFLKILSNFEIAILGFKNQTALPDKSDTNFSLFILKSMNNIEKLEHWLPKQAANCLITTKLTKIAHSQQQVPLCIFLFIQSTLFLVPIILRNSMQSVYLSTKLSKSFFWDNGGVFKQYPFLGLHKVISNQAWMPF